MYVAEMILDQSQGYYCFEDGLEREPHLIDFC